MIPAFVNPRAGTAEAALAALRSVGGFDIQETEPAALASAVEKAISHGAKRVLVAGGDGSIGTAASALAGTGIELAVLPGGTLNHLAKDLGLPLDLVEAARVALGERTTSVDAATLNGRLFLNTSAVGGYVAFVRVRERLEKNLGYGMASLIAGARMLVRMPTFHITLQVGSVAYDYVTPLVFIGVGERELKAPVLGARVPDGKSGLHVMVVRRRSGARALALALEAVTRGTDVVARSPALDSFMVDACTIKPRTKRASIDGEIVAVTPPLEYRHLPGCLRVVIPDSFEA